MLTNPLVMFLKMKHDMHTQIFRLIKKSGIGADFTFSLVTENVKNLLPCLLVYH